MNAADAILSRPLAALALGACLAALPAPAEARGLRGAGAGIGSGLGAGFALLALASGPRPRLAYAAQRRGGPALRSPAPGSR